MEPLSVEQAGAGLSIGEFSPEEVLNKIAGGVVPDLDRAPFTYI
jgi:hypothetical protein